MTEEKKWRKEFQYLLDRKILSRDELAYLFGIIKSIIERENQTFLSSLELKDKEIEELKRKTFIPSILKRNIHV